ncbi:hypothetical protein C8J56DRAFT_971216 [Mycena floridula]|nr:hypothetical protein C8J56DRAFT_971216 [Mycena floridula]
MEKPKNVIVFGETGTGKSSVVNMLADNLYPEQAKVSDSLDGVTFEASCYRRRIDGETYNIYDTVGLSEAHRGTVNPQDGIRALRRLMRDLKDGIHLLVLVTQGPHIKPTAEKNYKMFYEIFCDKKVPIVLLVTHMEDVVAEGQLAWWVKNGPVLEKKNMRFNGRACITASRGPGGVRGQQYEKSRIIVQQEIKDCCSRRPWAPGMRSWFRSVVAEMAAMFN